MQIVLSVFEWGNNDAEGKLLFAVGWDFVFLFQVLVVLVHKGFQPCDFLFRIFLLIPNFGVQTYQSLEIYVSRQLGQFDCIDMFLSRNPTDFFVLLFLVLRKVCVFNDF